MSDVGGPTAEVLDLALGTLAEWLPGYTYPETGPQQKITLVGVDDEGRYLDVRMGFLDASPSETKVFRVWLEAEEL
ncbi:hypothetical protein [Streptomyces ardesiacus]